MFECLIVCSFWKTTVVNNMLCFAPGWRRRTAFPRQLICYALMHATEASGPHVARRATCIVLQSAQSHKIGEFLSRSPSSALLPSFGVPLLKSTTEKTSWHPYSSLSTGGPSCGKGKPKYSPLTQPPSFGHVGWTRSGWGSRFYRLGGGGSAGADDAQRASREAQ